MTASDAHWLTTPIEGVLTRAVEFNSDDRGAFAELWRHSWTAAAELQFKQANLSISGAGVLRGVHFHERQTDLWVLLEGRALVAIVDLRPAIADGGRQATRPDSLTFELLAGQCTLIPPGVAHGFLALDQVRLLYMVTNEFDGADEHGFAWNDPRTALEWPTESPTLSPRDASALSLDEALAKLQQR